MKPSSIFRGGVPGRPVHWLICLMVLYFSLTSDSFLTVKNLLNVTQQLTPLFILALGATLVILANGLDLSMGAVMSLAGVLMALANSLGLPWPLALAIGIGTGFLCGLVNGLAIAYGRLPAFIVTLGMQGIASGAALIITQGISIAVSSKELQSLGVGNLFGVPSLLIASAISFVILTLVLFRTSFGNHILAIGGNEEGAVLAGVPVARTVFYLYTLSGLVSGVAGVLLAGWMYSGQPAVGIGLEFQAIAAVVMGGTALVGGRGSTVNTITGVAMIAILRNGLNIALVPNNWHTAIVGVFIVLVIALDTLVEQARSRAQLAKAQVEPALAS